MPFEFNSNQNKLSDILPSEISFSRKNTVIYSNYYQPNFILVDESNKNNLLLFGDILPIYKSYQELTNIVVASWEGLNSLILLSHTFGVCLLSLLNNILHNTVYQSYLFLAGSWEQVSLLPNRYNSLKNKIYNLLEIFSSAQNRELWWLEMKLDLKNVMRNVEKALGLFFQVTQKFYLALLVFFSLSVLNLVSFTSVNIESKSFLSKFIDNYSLASYTNSGNININASSESQALFSFASADSYPQFETIVSYEAKPGDTVENLAQVFGLNKETLTLNNNLPSEDLNGGEKIYAPFTDGYIVSLDKDTNVSDLSSVSKVESSIIIEQNKDLFDPGSKNFKKDSLVLIPSSDVQSVFNNFKAEEDRLTSIAQAQEQAKKRNQSLSRAAIPVSLNPNVKDIDDSKARNFAFVSPLNYSSISRCFSSYHRGCDLVASEGTTLRAVQDGVISRVLNFDVVGYGIGIIVDHGNGVSTLNAHLSKVNVKAGDVVKQGQKIGESGCTGRCYGAHLHFEVRVNGKQVNPKPYLP